MKRSYVETFLGFFVVAVAVFFLVYSYNKSNVSAASGLYMTADFAGIGGLKEGDDVLISGVKVGEVVGVNLVPETYLARVSINIDSAIELPIDTVALISSESLLGGRFLALEPGAEEDLIEDGGRIEFTQAPQNLEQLLGQFIFSMQTEDDSN